ncbi:MAG: 2-C-methyl-D-erythritol 2,4-cyclodiphosphate synthase [Fusobacteriota bacterium]
MYRIGNGYDVHKITNDRDLILGGVKIDWDRGLLGHSDADVLLHAIMDALLGALSLGDIGKHFPDTQKDYKGISSMKLLEKVYKLIQKKGFSIVNIDSIIVMEKPKLKKYIEKMKVNIAKVLQIKLENVSIKATTEEGLGFTGNKKGAKSYAVVLLKEEIN